MSADVIVIGAGLVGCASAHALARAGCSVRVVDRHQRATQAATRFAAGMLGAQLEDHPLDAMLKLCVASRALYPAWLEELGPAASEAGYEGCGALQVAFDDEHAELLRARVERHRGLGLAAELVPPTDVRRRWPRVADDLRCAAWLADDGVVDPPRLLDAVLDSAAGVGVSFTAGETVARVLAEGGRVTGVELAGGQRLSGGHVVVAAGAWSSTVAGAGLAEEAVQPVRGQMVRLRVQEALPCIVDTPDVYLSPRRDGRLLVGATVEHVGFERAVTAGAVRHLLGRAIRAVPSLDEALVDTAWCGFRPETRDRVPFLGPGPLEGLTIVTGHYRNGVVLAPITAKIVEALVLGQTPPVDLTPFRVDRPSPS